MKENDQDDQDHHLLEGITTFVNHVSRRGSAKVIELEYYKGREAPLYLIQDSFSYTYYFIRFESVYFPINKSAHYPELLFSF
jgi:hypothetical protein